jgi:hypothetical protein
MSETGGDVGAGAVVAAGALDAGAGPAVTMGVGPGATVPAGAGFADAVLGPSGIVVVAIVETGVSTGAVVAEVAAFGLAVGGAAWLPDPPQAATTTTLRPSAAMRPCTTEHRGTRTTPREVIGASRRCL